MATTPMMSPKRTVMNLMIANDLNREGASKAMRTAAHSDRGTSNTKGRIHPLVMLRNWTMTTICGETGAHYTSSYNRRWWFYLRAFPFFWL
jgi:hypothetical protein